MITACVSAPCHTLPSALSLPPLQPFLDAQLAAPSSSEGGEAEAPAAQVTKEDLSTALLATVAALVDLAEEVPKSPVLVAEVIGHFLAAGQLSFGLAELAAAVKDAGAAQQEANKEDGDGEGEDPPLVDQERAAPILLVVANAIKVCGGSWLFFGGGGEKFWRAWTEHPGSCRGLFRLRGGGQ
jgi:hypothetical protein